MHHGPQFVRYSLMDLVTSVTKKRTDKRNGQLPLKQLSNTLHLGINLLQCVRIGYGAWHRLQASQQCALKLAVRFP